jgi:RHS repeat-associated protein
VLEQTCQSLPFGDGLSCTGSITSPTEHHFTGKERDIESGNDYFGARYYSSAMGRWMSPDWSAKTEPVPYAKLDNPQSLNLYAYVFNNPLGGVDPDGHGCNGSTDGFCNPDVQKNMQQGMSAGDAYAGWQDKQGQAQQQGTQSSSHHKKNAQPTGLPQNGEASIYSDWFEGKTTASGETFSQNGYTAALLPKKRWHAVSLRTHVKITHDGRSVVVEVNDRGAGARDGSMTRVLDVTRTAASYLTGQTISNDNDSNSIGLISITITQVPNTTPLGPVSQEQK